MKQIAFRLKPGQFLKEEIEKAAAAAGVKAGVLLSIVAGLDRVVLRMAGSEANVQTVKTWEGDYEVVSGTGTFSQDGCHLHISASDKNGNVIGGHLKDGCRVRFTAEVVIGVFEDAVYRRLPDADTGFNELTIENI